MLEEIEPTMWKSQGQVQKRKRGAKKGEVVTNCIILCFHVTYGVDAGVM